MKWRVVYKIGEKWLTKYEFGTWDEVTIKYMGKSATLNEVKDGTENSQTE